MAAPFSLYLALKYLRQRRTFISVVTVISVVGVLLGVAILVIVTGVMTGFGDMWRDKILDFKAHLTVTSTVGHIDEPEALCTRIEQVKGVTGAAPAVQTLVLMRHGRREPGAPIVLGMPEERVGKVSRVPAKTAGNFVLDDENLVLGIDLAREMGISIGSKVLLYSPLNVLHDDEMYMPEELRVAGIFNMGMYNFDSRFVITSLDVARDLTGLEGGAESVYVMTDDPMQFEPYRKRLQAALGPTFRVETWRETDELMFRVLSHEKNLMFLLLAFISIVAIFCVTNTLIVITVQKTNEIGLLKALGFSSGKIMGAFVWHGLIQCVVGITLGLGVGLLVGANLNGIIDILSDLGVDVFPKSIYGFDGLPFRVAISDLRNVVGVVLLACSLASLLPAWRAARQDPVKALRHE